LVAGENIFPAARFFIELQTVFPPSDVTVENHECRAALLVTEYVQCMLDEVDIIRVANAEDVPSVSKKTGSYILGERDVRVALDGDVIVVVDPTEIIRPRCPASDAASEATSSIMQPSPHTE